MKMLDDWFNNVSEYCLALHQPDAGTRGIIIDAENILVRPRRLCRRSAVGGVLSLYSA